jgi:hypothetical protein
LSAVASAKAEARSAKVDRSIDVAPIERQSLAASQSRLATEKHDHVRTRIELFRRSDKLLERVEIVEPRHAFGTGRSLIKHGLKTKTTPAPRSIQPVIGRRA